MKKLLTASAAVAALSAMPLQAATLMTPADANNQQDGIMFDVVTGSNGIIFESLAVDLQAATGDFEFYTIAGGIAGNTDSAAGWTLRDTFAGVTGSAGTVFDAFDITDFSVAANSVVGFYITSTGPSSVRYHNGGPLGDVRATNGDLTILNGVGKDYAFGANFIPRSFSGSITFTAVPEPATWAFMIFGFGAVGGAMRRQRKANVKVSYA
ncbi:MAG: PEPxxWA-CTERM sorting domain-containing protein [Pseudomonadota bacterium]